MRMIAPRTGAPEQTIAEEQLEYKPITVCVYEMPDEGIVVLSRWTFSPEERAQIAGGADVYLAVLTDGNGVAPVQLQVGPDGWQVTLTPEEPRHE